jgi:hypothetical protein
MSLQSGGLGEVHWNTMVGIVALLVALVLYTLGVWGAFRAKGARPPDLVLLWIALAFDVLATVMMGLTSGGLDLSTPANTLHTVLALVAFAGMLVFTAVATWARSAGRDSVGSAVAKWIIAPWALWVAVFVWGTISRMPHR